MQQDVRWRQRFENYRQALSQLADGIDNNPGPSAIIKEGIIQRFEFTHELAWKVMKDFLEYEGFQNISGSRTATREAFNKKLITDGQAWMDMIASRNNTVHTYNINILEIEFEKIITTYFPLLSAFEKHMQTLL